MDAADRARILSWLKSQAIRKELRLANASTVAKKLVALDLNISPEAATDYYYARNINSHTVDLCSVAVLKLFEANLSKVSSHLDEQNQRMLSELISLHLDSAGGPQKPREVLTADQSAQRHANERVHRTPDPASSRGHYTEVLFENWRTSGTSAGFILPSGIYQMFRRYKPERSTNATAPQDAPGVSSFEEHAVICELIHVDSQTSECVMITSERYVYVGSMFLNFEGILFGIMQRKLPNSNNINQRVISIKLELNALPWYSGLCIKAGDTTHRPLAAECIFLPVPPSHTKLQKEFEYVMGNAGESYRVAPESEIAQYLTDTPSYQVLDSKHSRVRRVRDFPGIVALSRKNDRGITFFREPLRTLDGLTVLSLSRNINLRVFRQDARRQRAKPPRPAPRSK